MQDTLEITEKLEGLVSQVVRLVNAQTGQFCYGRLSKGEITGLYRVISGTQIDAVFVKRVWEVQGQTIVYVRGA